MITIKNVITSLLFCSALTLSAWSIWISHPHQASTAHEDPTVADIFMEDVIATFLNKRGTPSLKLVTPKMTHFPEDDTTKIQTPHVTIFRDSPKPWYIDSEYAKAKHGINEIEFKTNVSIHHPADVENPTTTMQTDSLTIFPNKQVASTDQAVTFIQPDTTIHAVGMLADLDKGTIKLQSQAIGEYVPAS